MDGCVATLGITKDMRPLGIAESLFYVIFGMLCISGNFLSYLLDAGLPCYDWYQALTCSLLPLLPVLVVLVFRSRDPTAQSWYMRYCNTPGQRLGMVVFYVCCWGFVCHVVTLVVTYNCDVCVGIIGKQWPAGSLVAKYFPSAFWLHVPASGIIALLAPLQFTEKIRKWNSFQVHRWIGRFVLLVSCVHQTGATYLTFSNIFFNRHNAFPTSWAANTVYALAFAPFNLCAWIATIQGWRCARQRRINEHGAWMYRLCGMWIVFTICFRAMDAPLEYIAGEEWGLALQMCVSLLLMIPVEIYVQKSGRFKWDATSKIAGANGAIDRCPFLKEPMIAQ